MVVLRGIDGPFYVVVIIVTVVLGLIVVVPIVVGRWVGGFIVLSRELSNAAFAIGGLLVASNSSLGGNQQRQNQKEGKSPERKHIARCHDGCNEWMNRTGIDSILSKNTASSEK